MPLETRNGYIKNGKKKPSKETFKKDLQTFVKEWSGEKNQVETK